MIGMVVRAEDVERPETKNMNGYIPAIRTKMLNAMVNTINVVDAD